MICLNAIIRVGYTYEECDRRAARFQRPLRCKAPPKSLPVLGKGGVQIFAKFGDPILLQPHNKAGECAFHSLSVSSIKPLGSTKVAEIKPDRNSHPTIPHATAGFPGLPLRSGGVQVFGESDIAPNYIASRRFAALSDMTMRLTYSHHQIVFSDDIEAARGIIGSHLLHVDHLIKAANSKVLQLIAGFSLSTEEVRGTPRLMVDLPGKETGVRNDDWEALAQDATNQDRSVPWRIAHIMHVSPFSKPFGEMALQIYQEMVSLPIETLTRDPRELQVVSSLADPYVSPRLLRRFDTDGMQSAFLCDASQIDPTIDSHAALKSIARGLESQLRYSDDHGDYIRVVPTTIWLMSIDQMAEFNSILSDEMLVDVIRLPQYLILNRPMNTWMPFCESAITEFPGNRHPMVTSRQASLWQVEDAVRNTAQMIQPLSDAILGERYGFSASELAFLRAYKPN